MAGFKVPGFAKMLGAALVFSSIGFSCLADPASSYPDRATKIVVPFPPGAYTDLVARIVADGLSKTLKQPFVVENHPGAAGNIGTEYVARSNPDGYTLIVGTAATTISASIYTNLRYDYKNDLRPVALLAELPYVLVVNPSLPVHSVPELVDYAKGRPGGMNVASTGVGAATYLGAMLFAKKAGFKLVNVPYPGIAPAVNDVIAGHVPMMLTSLDSVISGVKAGKLRALAVSSAEPVSELPDVPTLSKYYPGINLSAWAGLLAPSGTPTPIVDKLNQAINEVLSSDSVKRQFATVAAQPRGGTPQAFADMMADDASTWASIAKDAGIKLTQ